MTVMVIVLLSSLAVLLWPIRQEGQIPPRQGDRGPSSGSAWPLSGAAARLGRWRPSPRDGPEASADVASVVALGLDAGLSLDGALALAGCSPGQETRLPSLLEKALRLSAVTGAPVAPAARWAADALREREAAAHRVRTQVAGARTSMHVLTVLPASGPLFVTLLGASVREVYAAPLAMVSAGVGVMLTVLGWWSAHSLLVRAARPTLLRRPRARG